MPTRKKTKLNKKSFKSKLAKFKKAVEKKLGKINWKKVGVFAIALLLIVASKGILGPEAKLIAGHILSFMSSTAV